MGTSAGPSGSNSASNSVSASGPSPTLPLPHLTVPLWRLRVVRSYYFEDAEIDALEHRFIRSQFRALLQRIQSPSQRTPPTPILTPGSSIERIWYRHKGPLAWLVVEDTAGNMVRWRDYDRRHPLYRQAVSVFEMLFARQRAEPLPQRIAHDDVLGNAGNIYSWNAWLEVVRRYMETTWEPVVHCVYFQQSMDFFTPEEWEFTRARLAEFTLPSAVDMASTYSLSSTGVRSFHY